MEERYNEYLITDCEKGYMVINENMVSTDNVGHTHCRSYDYAKHLVRIALNRTIPRHKGITFLQNLARITKSLRRQKQLYELITIRENKQTQKYNNEPSFYA